MPRRGAVSLFCTLACLLTAGCGGVSDQPDLGTVTGLVTLDGQPLPKVKVEFSPKEGGRTSYGETDEAGRYALIYSTNAAGAKIGPHIVRVSTPLPPGEDDTAAPADDPIPPQYNTDSTLEKTVEPGSNELDLALTS